MPPSLRRRAQQHHLPPPTEQQDDTDSDIDLTPRTGHDDEDAEIIGEDHGHLVALDDEEEEEELDEEDELGSPDQGSNSLPNLEPPPPYLREISTLASWTVSSSKPGCSIPQLRHPSTSLFWQSDGPQPHYLNIHFFKLVRIVGLRLYLDFEQDESYTPTRIIFLAGSGMNDLQEWGEMRLENPRGWIWADFSGVGDPDDSSDDEDEDMSDVGDSHPHMPARHHQPIAGETPGQDITASSDSENAAPPPLRPNLRSAFSNDHYEQASTPLSYTSPYHPHTTPIRMAPGAAAAGGGGRGAGAGAAGTPATHFPGATTLTPSHLPRPSPRTPFTTLTSTTAPPPPPSSSRSRRAPKLPTLRAHLVQIKILENHQNGKDTHLRGLQVFARSEEDDGERKAKSSSTGGLKNSNSSSSSDALSRSETVLAMRKRRKSGKSGSRKAITQLDLGTGGWEEVGIR